MPSHGGLANTVAGPSSAWSSTSQLHRSIRLDPAPIARIPSPHRQPRSIQRSRKHHRRIDDRDRARDELKHAGVAAEPKRRKHSRTARGANKLRAMAPDRLGGHTVSRDAKRDTPARSKASDPTQDTEKVPADPADLSAVDHERRSAAVHQPSYQRLDPLCPVCSGLGAQRDHGGGIDRGSQAACR